MSYFVDDRRASDALRSSTKTITMSKEIFYSVQTGHEAVTNIPVLKQKIELDLTTLLSDETSWAIPGEYVDIQGVMRNIYKDVIQNPLRKKKYESFLAGAFKLDRLWRLARLPDPEHRFSVFVLTYAQQRLFDDIVDGDTPLCISPQQRVLFAEEKLSRFKTGRFSQSDPVEAFAIRILDDIRVLDPSYVDAARHRLSLIMSSIAFDGHRILEREQTKKWQFFPKEVLEEHFFDLDIDGTTGLTLFLFGLKDTERNMLIMKPLGQLSRIAYNLQDFFSDIKEGLCNISLEDAKRLGITDEDLQFVVANGKNTIFYPENVKEWLREQVVRGEALIRQHDSEPHTSLEMVYPIKGIVNTIRNYGYKYFVKTKVLSGVYIKEAKEVFAEF